MQQKDLSSQHEILNTVLSGLSAIDLPRLKVENLTDAHAFIRGYGYDVTKQADLQKLWQYHRRAVTILQEEILEAGEKIPDELAEQRTLGDIGHLLLFASEPIGGDKQKWSCAILRVMHVLVHLSNDLFANFPDEIQEQILRPLQDHIHKQPASNQLFLGESTNGIRLERFDIKSAKSSTSSVVKLLAKKEMVALRLFDRLGVRFVTRTMFDAFQVVNYLIDQYLISFPHIMPDQSNNTLYPLNLFMQLRQKLPSHVSVEKFEAAMESELQRAGEKAEFNQKENHFTDRDFRFIKFIVRKLIHCDDMSKTLNSSLNFFYPYEIQIMTYDTYIKNLTGPSAHEEYKKRQRIAAHNRVFGRMHASFHLPS